MARISKAPDVRRAELLEAASELFTTRGYANTSVDDIVRVSSVAKGTFYYYFKTKEDVLAAVIEKLSMQGAALVEPLVEDVNLNALEKLKLALFVLRMHFSKGHTLQGGMQTLPDEGVHTKYLFASTFRIAPLVHRIIEQGISEGVFVANHPLEVAEIFLLSSNFLLDDSLLPGQDARKQARMEALEALLEHALGIAPGTLKE